MAKTKCPARYKNLGLETFGNKRKVTEEMLKQFCKNDEYLYQQIRILLDLTDPESRKRFYPPYYDDEIKSFGYAEGKNKDNKPCYMFHQGGTNIFQVDFKTSNDGSFRRGDVVYDRNESIIDYDKTGDAVHIFVDDNGVGHAQIPQMTGTKTETRLVKEAEDVQVPVTVKKGSSTTVATGKAKLDSYCYGPYGSMRPNGWWYLGYDKNKNYSVKAKWKKEPYTEGIPTKCRAQTFTARHTGWVTQVNLNLKTESKKKTASPFSCEIWATKNGVPHGGPLGRVEKSFTNTGGRIESFVFKKKVSVKKGKKYAIVMRSPLSHEGACYRTTGWPRTCYTNFMKGTYYYGYAFQSLNNGKTWVKYDKNAYGKLHYTASTMPVAFGFEVYVQPTKQVKSKATVTQYITEHHDAVYEDVEVPYSFYPKGNHYLYFNIPSTNPINYLSINNLTDGGVRQGQVKFEISYNGEEWNNNFHMTNNGDGTGSYDLTSVRPTFVMVRCNLYTDNEEVTPDLTGVEFITETNPSRKAYIRTLPYCPESETMLPACIWSEVNVEYESEPNTDVKVDIVIEKDLKEGKITEVEAQEIISIRKDTIEEIGGYYLKFYPNKTLEDVTDEQFRAMIKDDTEFFTYLRNQSPPVFVVCALPPIDINYRKYFDKIELSNYPAYPMLGCKKILKEINISASEFYRDRYNVERTEYEFDTGINLTNDMVNIVFQEPKSTQEGVVENVLVEGTDYRIDGQKIIFLLNGENFVKNVVKDTNTNEIKCFKTSEGVHDLVLPNEFINTINLLEDLEKYLNGEKNFSLDDIPNGENTENYLGDVIDLVINLKETSFNEHMHYDFDYNKKQITMKNSMEKDLGSCDLLFSYNPLWVRDLTNKDFPLKMDMWTETFEAEEGQTTFVTKVAPRDNLREVVINDEADTIDRIVLEEDEDFVVDYLTNTITFNEPLEEGMPVTIRYTPNLTDTSLSIAYRMDRENDSSQAYIYNNHFTTRT